ncbi:MAG: low molecular weight phosphotyrosine protein phosphatase, partial [Gammaproteobacteria bacterium]
ARASQAALRRGIDLSSQRARRFSQTDFEQFYYILAMDSSNYTDLSELCAPEHSPKLRLFLEFASVPGITEVPDPYYGGSTGFERVLDLIEEASAGLLETLRRQHGL